MLQGQRFDVRPFVTARYPVAEAEAAFEHAARRGSLKVLLEFAD